MSTLTKFHYNAVEEKHPSLSVFVESLMLKQISSQKIFVIRIRFHVGPTDREFYISSVSYFSFLVHIFYVLDVHKLFNHWIVSLCRTDISLSWGYNPLLLQALVQRENVTFTKKKLLRDLPSVLTY